MRILFVGDEEELDESMIPNEDAKASSFFISASRPSLERLGDFDAAIVPALRYLRWDLEASLAPSERSVPILASGPAGMIGECLEAGCADYLREPWTFEECLARLSRIRAPERLGATPPGLSVHSASGSRLAELLEAANGRALSRAEIAQELGIAAPYGRAVDMRVARLRAGLRSRGDFETAARIRCEHGSYRLIRACG